MINRSIERREAVKNEAFNSIQQRLPMNYFLGEGYNEYTRFVMYVKPDSTTEKLAVVSLKVASYSINPEAYTLKSSRIPQTRRSYGQGQRRYKSLDSLMKGIAEFAKPVSTNERYVEEQSLVLDQLSRRVVNYTQKLNTPTYELSEIIALMASDEYTKAAKGQERLRKAVIAKRKSDRFNRRAEKWVIGPVRARKNKFREI